MIYELRTVLYYWHFSSFFYCFSYMYYYERICKKRYPLRQCFKGTWWKYVGVLFMIKNTWISNMNMFLDLIHAHYANDISDPHFYLKSNINIRTHYNKFHFLKILYRYNFIKEIKILISIFIMLAGYSALSQKFTFW